ncbi:hypothetical protein FRB95_008528 [Tulasnella sp. JGI-2019a]|nr:hypothetical protein FRB95_008528 [Tulasnella sp. JGI-2019a]
MNPTRPQALTRPSSTSKKRKIVSSNDPGRGKKQRKQQISCLADHSSTEVTPPEVNNPTNGSSATEEAKATVESGNVIVAATEESRKGTQDHMKEGEKETKSNKRPTTKEQDPAPVLPKVLRQKLAPPRPWPSVPTSSSATGPRSSRAEGNNMVCITRKTELSQYLRRCKKLVVEDGYKTIHLAAMGAAIPLLLTLATSLPEILPYSHDTIHTEYRTGTVTCMDELVPLEESDDDDSDNGGTGKEPNISSDLQKRRKSSVQAVVRIGDGKKEVSGKEKRKKNNGTRRRPSNGKGKGKMAVGSDDEMLSSDDDL